MLLRVVLFLFLLSFLQTAWGIFPFLRCDGLGDFSLSPAYCRVCFASQAGSNNRLCSQAYFNQSPDVHLLTQNLEDDFGNNFNKLKRLPDEGFDVFERKGRKPNACVDSFKQLEFVEKQIEYLNAKKQELLNSMNASNCSPPNSRESIDKRLPASQKNKEN